MRSRDNGKNMGGKFCMEEDKFIHLTEQPAPFDKTEQRRWKFMAPIDEHSREGSEFIAPLNFVHAHLTSPD
jgi:hypothetical protein